MKIHICIVFTLLTLSIFLIACSSEEKEKVFSKEGSVETTITVDHLDSNNDVIKTTHNVWVKNQIIKKYEHLDTVPALGTMTQDTVSGDGETKSVSIAKDYELYITIK